MSKTDGQIKDNIDRDEKRSKYCGWAVVIGLVIEIFLAADFAVEGNSTFIENWGPVFADALVALGVWGEIFFAGRVSQGEAELRLRSDEKVTDAMNRAAAAEEALAPRNLSEEQFNHLQELKGTIAEIALTTCHDFESVRFGRQISLAFQHAGIRVRLLAPRLGNLWPNLYVVLPQPSTDVSKEPLYLAFKKGGLSVGCGPRSRFTITDMPTDMPVVMVGEKGPLWPSTPPFMDTLQPPE
jgi:hypothetical protein